MNILNYTHSWLMKKLDPQLNNFNISKQKASDIIHHSLSTLLTGILRSANDKEQFNDLIKRINHEAVTTDLENTFDNWLGDSQNAKHVQNSGGNISQFLLADKHDAFISDLANKFSISNSDGHIFNNISAYGLFAVLKRYLSGHDNNSHGAHLSNLLSSQVSHLQNHFSDSTSSLLGWGSAAALLGSFSDKFRKLFVDFGGNIGEWGKDLSAEFGKAFGSIGDFGNKTIDSIKHGAADLKDAANCKMSGCKSNWMKWLWLIPLLLVLAWLLKYCAQNKNNANLAISSNENASMVEASNMTENASMLEQTTATATMAPNLNINIDKDGVAQVQAKVGSEEQKQSLLVQLKQVFGDKLKADIQITENTHNANWLTDLGKWLPQLNLPNSKLSIENNIVSLDGATSDPKLGLVDKIKGLVGSGIEVVANTFNPEQASVAANMQASTALSALKDGECEQDALITALNMQSVNFASGGHSVPKATQDLLKANVSKIKACSGKFKLKVEGHTDNQGKADANLELSKKRAQSIAAYLISIGVKQQDIVVEGFGNTKPIADNTDAAGRFKNRRIEFAAH